MRLDELIKEYRAKFATMTHKEKALAEEEIFLEAKTTPFFNVGLSYRKWFINNVSKEGYSGVEDRRAILSRGPAMDPLWEHVEKKKLSARAMCDLYRAIRALQRNEDLTCSEALTRLLNQSKRVHRPGFKESKKKMSVQKRRSAKRIHKKEVPSAPPETNGVESSKQFLKTLREHASQFIRNRLSEMDETVWTAIAKDFETNLKVAVDELFSRINSTKQTNKELSHNILTIKMRTACDVLDVRRPYNGKFDVVAARKKFRMMASALHPDKNPDPAVEQRYREVQEAWKVVQDWCQTCGKGSK